PLDPAHAMELLFGTSAVAGRR
ncbi:MAG: hypothetical protein QOG57_850, partial [Pseudonocardiales bacterium]|nr:hypothetical protein [Pseudonocardiales bacterium]